MGTGYKLVVVLHILCAIVGFGAIALDSLYAAQTRRFRGPEAHAVAQAHYAATAKVSEPFLYALPVLGILAVLLSSSGAKISMGDSWVSMSFLVYIATLGVLHGMVRPARRKALVLLGELAGAQNSGGAQPSQTATLAKLGQKLSLGSALINLLLVIAVILMVFKP